jgi:hypothetical protein
VTDNAEAWLNDDYVANNQVRGAVVDTKVDVPGDADTELAPVAYFHGVALVCNGDASDPDAHGAVTFAASCTQCTDEATCQCTTDDMCVAMNACASSALDPCTPVTCHADC